MRYLLTVFMLLSVVAWLPACEGHKGSSKTTVTHAPMSDDQDKELPRVAIKDFAVRGISESDAAGISSAFCTHVSKSRKIELVCSEDLKTFFEIKEFSIKFGQCQEGKCLTEMAAAINADYIVTGNFDKVGETMIFGVKLVNGKDGKVLTRLSKEVASDEVEDLLPVSSEVAAELVKEFQKMF